LNQLWYVSYPDGELRRITNDLSHYRAVSVTAVSDNLVAVQNEQLSNIWVAPNGDASRARQITSGAGKQEGASTISWTPDGKIVYVSLTTSGRPSIWVTGADGTGQRQITDGLYNAERPAVSPDGRYVVFESNRAGPQNIWRIDINGLNLKRLTDGPFDILASCSPDGHWVIYSSERSGGLNLWKMPIDGGGSVQLTNAPLARGGIVSPDGKLITCWYVAQSLVQTGLQIAVIPFEGGDPIKTFDLQPTAFPPPGPQPNYLRWTSDSRAVLYIDTRGGVSNIWSQPVEGGKPVQVTDFKTDRIFSFDYSRDGKQLALARGTQISDVVLISNFR
jgi:Tol biopolymer transport system component